MKRIITLILFLVFALPALPVSADEGLWLPALIESRVKDMRKKGFKLKGSDLYDKDKPSLNDAVVFFAGGCTGAIVSDEGLLLTNHHCGYSQIQRHSTLEDDYLTNGFRAMNRSEELPNAGLEVRIMVRMENVTDGVNSGRRKELIATAEENGRYKADIKPLYYGNEHWMWVYEVFTDVRMVIAPPSSIGKFGGDTDNWMWPRHTGDFAVFRIYADKDNRPADYSTANVPYKPKRFFSIATEGVKEGDFTFVYGFPGTTQEYITSDAVKYTLEKSNPMRINMRTLRLDIIGAARNADPATRIKYATKQAGIANAWKKWQGESKGLHRLETIEKKRAYEVEFQRWAADKPEYAHLLDSLQAAYARLSSEFFRQELLNETINAIELNIPIGIAAQRKHRPLSEQQLNRIESFYKDYDVEIDRQIAAELLKGFIEYSDRVPACLIELMDSLGSPAAVAHHMLRKSSFTSAEKFAQASCDSISLVEASDAEPLLKLRRAIIDEMTLSRLSYPGQLSAMPEISKWYIPYMQALREFDTQRAFYPDANLTLRISYGHVKGYRYEDGVWHEPVTTLDGIMAKDNPDIYDYDIPEKLREVYAAKDYGRWAVSSNGQQTVPVCFIASNQTSGGNSGSPVLNARGELLGLNFDRTWLSTMSDIEFDPDICRNISVDIRYVLFVIEKISGAGWVVEEMISCSNR